MRPLPRSLMARALVAGGALFLLAGCRPTETIDKRAPQRVKTVVLAETDYEPALTLTGEVRAQFQTDVSFRVSGRILARSAEVGDHVAVGQVLAKIDPQEQNADVAAAQAVLDSANAQLRQVSATFDRQKELIAKGFTTRRDYDQAEAAWRAAKASVDSAVAQLGVAQERLGDTELKAPVPGVITARNIEAGQVIQAAQPAFSIAQDGPRDAVFNVYNTLAAAGGRVSPDVKIILLADPKVVVDGNVREVSPTVDATNGTIRVKVGLIDPPPAMNLGAPVRGVAHIEPRKVIALPPRALSEKGGAPAAWILDPKTNTVSLRNFAIDRYATDWIIVADGLKAGETVVADGSQLLRPGETIVPDEASAQASPVAPPSGASAPTTERSQPNAAAAPLVRPVLSVVVKPSLGGAVVFAGSIEPRYSAVLGFRILGRIVARKVDVGDIVRKDDLLAALDSTSLELGVRQAVAGVVNAQAQLTNAAATEARQRALVEGNNAAQSQLDTARMGMETAQAAVAQAQASLAKAQEQLGYAQLHADFDGVVTAVDADVGQVVSPGQKVVTLARPDVREAVVDVPDDLANSLTAAARFEVKSELNETVTAIGQVREVAPQADAATRTRRVRITLESPPDGLRLGSTITAKLVNGAKPRIELPASAILEAAGKTSVWVVDPRAGTVSLQDVSIAAHGDRVEVLSGLSEGARVVTAGVHSLAAGQAVRAFEGDRS